MSFETYKIIVLGFPLPGELKEKILWFLLMGIMEDKLSNCLPRIGQLDIFEKTFNETMVWTGHIHTTTCSNFIEENRIIMAYDHVFQTDCGMWFESSNVEEQEFSEANFHQIYYKSHCFGLLKKGKMPLDGEESDDSFVSDDDNYNDYVVNYYSLYYLDGSIKLASVQRHR